MVEALNEQLPRHYLAIGEQSLQSCSMMSETRKHPSAVIVQEVTPQRTLGKIVTRIELLSPSNKPGGSDFRVYAEKRVEAIQSGVPLVEIDYLHETPSPLRNLPVYPVHAEAYLYTIVISDPRPNWQEGGQSLRFWSGYGHHQAAAAPGGNGNAVI